MEETMTTRQLADTAGVDIDTIRKVAKKIFPLMQLGKGVIARYSKEQSEAILSKVGKKNFIERNISVPEQNISVPDIAKIVSMTVIETLKAIGYLQIPNQQQQIAQLSPPNPRSELNSIIRKYAESREINFGVAWSHFYDRVYYRLSINLNARAKEGKKPMDIAEEMGIMDKLLALAFEEFSV